MKSAPKHMGTTIRHGFTMALWVGLAACSHSSPTPVTSAKTTETASEVSTMRIPQVLMGAPERPFIDLGPVLVPREDKKNVNRDQALLIAADKLGADAFIFERQTLNELYRTRLVAVRTYIDRYDRGPVEVREHVYYGPGRAGEADVGYYRAIRYVPEQQPPCRIASSDLDPAIQKLLGDAATLREQVRILNVLFANGSLQPPKYRALRRQCVASLDDE